jgi:hypothetical protein
MMNKGIGILAVINELKQLIISIVTFFKLQSSN